MPFNLAPVVSAFLRRSINKEMAEVTGNKVNRGAGHGLEIPCKYHFFGSASYIERLKTIMEKQDCYSLYVSRIVILKQS